MSEPQSTEGPERDPAEVEPTDNSAGAEVDLDRVAEVEREAKPGG